MTLGDDHSVTYSAQAVGGATPAVALSDTVVQGSFLVSDCGSTVLVGRLELDFRCTSEANVS